LTLKDTDFYYNFSAGNEVSPIRNTDATIFMGGCVIIVFVSANHFSQKENKKRGYSLIDYNLLLIYCEIIRELQGFSDAQTRLYRKTTIL